ncbi:hypothetical protein Holit_02312 [Hollandina sp. SP2]
MKKMRMRKTAGRGLGMFYAAGLVLILLGCQDPVTELRYVDREVSVPYGIRIETAADLAKIGIDPEFPANGEYYLGEDIDLSDLDPEPSGIEEEGEGPGYVWRPIGSTCKECGGPLISSRATSDQGLPISCINEDCTLYSVSQEPFSGIFHGNGKKISGLVLSGGTKQDGYQGALYAGLFGYIQGAYIHSLTIELANTEENPVVYTGNGTQSDIPIIAALAGFASSSKIEDITLEAKAGAGLYVIPSQNTTYIGGAVGHGQGTTLTKISSAIPLNSTATETASEQYMGGIAGSINSGNIENAKMTGTITIGSEGSTVIAGGIVGSGQSVSVKKSDAAFEALKIHYNRTVANGNSITAGGIAGQGVNLTGCTATFTALEIDAEGIAVGAISLGGLLGSSGSIEAGHARFDTITVTVDRTTAHTGNVIVGGLLGWGTNQKITSSYLEGSGTITVTAPNRTYNKDFYVGGLAGEGDISRSRIPEGIVIGVETGTWGTIYSGGLTGKGVAEYSFIGSRENPATVQVTRKNSDPHSNFDQAFVGGISGYALLGAYSGTKSFQYNYAFCTVSLETQGASTISQGQSVGGLAGYVEGSTHYNNGSFTESYAAGAVTLTNNYEGAEEGVSFNAGGIAGYTFLIPISRCAALNGAVTIDGINTAAAKNWRRIAYPKEQAELFSHNITTVTQTIPSGYTLQNGPDTGDGELKTSSLGQTDFGIAGLNWDFENTWEWDSAAGLPVLQGKVFED